MTKLENGHFSGEKMTFFVMNVFAIQVENEQEKSIVMLGFPHISINICLETKQEKNISIILLHKYKIRCIEFTSECDSFY